LRSIATIFCLSLFVTSGSAQTTAPPAPVQQPAVQAPAQPVTGPTADQLLQRGRENYEAGRYAEAVQDLRAASAAFLSPEEKQRYIDTGKLSTLPQVEQSLVYVALAYAKLGKEPEARDAIMRLANAERIAPTFAALPLDAETAEFPTLVARIAPGVTLPQNEQLARGGAAVTQPAAVAQVQPPTVPQAAVATTSTGTSGTIVAPTPTPTPAVVAAQAQPAPATTPAAPTAAADRAAMLRQMDEQVAEARAQIEREAAAKIAEAKRQADARVAAEKVAADKAAQEEIAAGRAAAEKAASERIAADRAAIERDTEAKIAADRATAEKAAQAKSASDRAAADKAAQEKAAADQKIADARAAAEKESRQRIAAAESEQQRTWLTNLRRGESLAQSGNLDEANAVYVAVANAPNAPREIVAAAATGLYRTSDFRDAVSAFARLAAFAHGEEDLRYYNAVSLFEIGRFDEAKRELVCALPFIQPSDDVMRYRAKIEQTPSERSAR
jgi:hypothetical protein